MTIPFTAGTYHQLEADLERLLKTEKEVIVRLQEAREQGDLSENGAYHYAKFELGATRRQLREVKYLLSNGQISQAVKSGTVGFGSKVTLKDGDTEVTYLLVSKHESNLIEKKLSLESPLGQALIGRKIGDKVKFETPKGIKTYIVLKIE